MTNESSDEVVMMPMISPALLEDVKPKHTHSQTLHENPITIDVVSEIQEILDEAS